MWLPSWFGGTPASPNLGKLIEIFRKLVDHLNFIATLEIHAIL